MSSVIPIKRKGNGGPPITSAHIDRVSYLLLVDILIGFLELRITEGNAGRFCPELESLSKRLESLAERFTPFGGGQ